jgi:monoterpene epsilon-lactone hydrolase
MPSIKSYLYRSIIRRKMRGTGTRTIQESRDAMEATTRRFRMPSCVDVRPVEVAGRQSEWLVPSGKAKAAAILYLHGGAYNAGSLNTHRTLAAEIAKASGISVLVLGYRLAPEHPFPAGLEDAVKAYEWLLHVHGIAPHRILLAGDSAGGGLALATALRLRDRQLPQPGGVICLSPWTNLQLNGKSMTTRAKRDPFFQDRGRIEMSASAYAGSHPRDHCEISPLYGCLQGGFPPLFIQVGDHEILLSDSLDLAETARAAGIAVELEVWPSMWHVWQIFGSQLREAREAIARIGTFARARIAEVAL